MPDNTDWLYTLDGIVTERKGETVYVCKIDKDCLPHHFVAPIIASAPEALQALRNTSKLLGELAAGISWAHVRPHALDLLRVIDNILGQAEPLPEPVSHTVKYYREDGALTFAGNVSFTTKEAAYFFASITVPPNASAWITDAEGSTRKRNWMNGNEHYEAEYIPLNHADELQFSALNNTGIFKVPVPANDAGVQISILEHIRKMVG